MNESRNTGATSTLYTGFTPESGVISLMRWPEGFVLRYHGEHVWKSWDPRTPAVALSEEAIVQAAITALNQWLDSEDDEGKIAWDRIVEDLELGSDVEPWLEQAAKVGARAAAALRTAPASDDLAADAYIRRGLPVPWEARTAPAEGVAVAVPCVHDWQREGRIWTCASCGKTWTDPYPCKECAGWIASGDPMCSGDCGHPLVGKLKWPAPPAADAGALKIGDATVTGEFAAGLRQAAARMAELRGEPQPAAPDDLVAFASHPDHTSPMTVGPEAFFEDLAIDWTSELETARIDLCHFWLNIADEPSEGKVRYPELGRRAIETEQVLTILGEIARTAAAAIQRLQSENERLEDELDEARYAPWPEWVKKVLAVIRERSGYDGHDDAIDGVDLPAELDECMSELERMAEKHYQAARAERETEQYKSSAAHYQMKFNEHCKRVEDAETRAEQAEAKAARLEGAAQEAIDLLTERTHGSPARSPGHNARLKLEAALAPAPAGAAQEMGGGS
jgi:hypothetical protein